MAEVKERKSKVFAFVSPRVPQTRQVSLEKFLHTEWKPNQFKYEWNNGMIEKRKKMKVEERYIIDNILTKFNLTENYKSGNRIMPEADVLLETVNTYRRPDATYLTKAQIRNQEAMKQPPLWVIELLSESNSSLEMDRKLEEYFQAGVQVVWYIFAPLKKVYVYTSPKEVKICTDNDVCAALDFSIGVNEVFE
jgi:Uma2 family endonuclease